MLSAGGLGGGVHVVSMPATYRVNSYLIRKVVEARGASCGVKKETLSQFRAQDIIL